MNEGVEVYCFLVPQCTPTIFPKGLTPKCKKDSDDDGRDAVAAVHRLVGLLGCTNTQNSNTVQELLNTGSETNVEVIYSVLYCS